jgi:hypothetical protein
MRIFFVVGLSVFGLISSSSFGADDITKTIEVPAVAEARQNVIVQFPLEQPYAPGRAVTVTDAKSGQAIPAQLTHSSLAHPERKSGSEVVFILDNVPANEPRSFKATISDSSSTAAAKESFRWTEQPTEYLELSFDERPVLRYMMKPLDDKNREQTYKVYHHVYSPDGKQIITKGPGGQFTHHRGIFYGFKVSYGEDLKKVADIWHCTKGTHQSHKGVASTDVGPVLGRHVVNIDWHGNEKEVFAKEQRELTAYNTPGGTLIEFASVVTPVNGTIKVDGDPQHAGFHFRASNEVHEKTKGQTYYVRPDGKDKPGATRNWDNGKNATHKNLPWNAMSAVIGGERYTVGYLDLPTNPKDARFSERDYGRFGSYFVSEATPDKPLRVDYRIWVQPGETTVEEMAARSAAFVEGAKRP